MKKKLFILAVAFMVNCWVDIPAALACQWYDPHDNYNGFLNWCQCIGGKPYNVGSTNVGCTPPAGGGSNVGSGAASGLYQTSYQLGYALGQWLFSSGSNPQAALQKQQMMEELRRRQAEAEHQHQEAEARRLAAMYNRLSATLKLSGLPNLQLKETASNSPGLKLKLGDSADGQAGIKGLPGIYLNDGKVPYGIPGLSGIYVGGPRQGSGLSNSKLALKTGESEAGIPQVASPATGTNQGGQSSAAPATDTSASSSPLLVNKSGLQLKTDNSDTTITAKHTTLDPSKMTPQQLADVAEMVSKLPPEEQQRLLAAAQNDAAAGHPVPSTNAQPRAKVPAPLQQQATASQAAAAAPNMEDASAKARAGFDSALPPSNSVPLSLSSNSHNSTISVPPNPIAQQTISVVDLSNKKATYTESKFFYALQASTLTPMKDGGHPIDTLESPSVGLHGLVGGTTWTFGFQWPHKKCDTKCMKDIERNLITNQLALFCSSQSDLKKCTLPFTKESYDLVVSMGSAHTAIQDLAIRVAWDGALFGEFSRQNKEIFASLKGRQFDTLDCHSNGAMLCLAALRSGDTTAKTVRLFGPQINPQAAALWRDWAHETGANIEIYINNGDPVPAISWKQPTPQTTVGKAFTAAWIVHPVVGIATIADALTYTWIDRKSAPMDNVLRDYGFKVTRLYPKRCDSIHIIDCHSMLLYEKTVGILTAEH